MKTQDSLQCSALHIFSILNTIHALLMIHAVDRIVSAQFVYASHKIVVPILQAQDIQENRTISLVYMAYTHGPIKKARNQSHDLVCQSHVIDLSPPDSVSIKPINIS
jgi:hypothetical protein